MTAPARRTTRARTLAADLLVDVNKRLGEIRAGTYPLVQYQTDIVGYVRERLRVEHITPDQERILRAFEAAVRHEGQKDTPHHPRVAVRSGQKTGKTFLSAWLAYWYFECFAEGRVLMCAAIEQQTKNVLWHAMNKVYQHAKRSGSLIDGKFSASPSGGFMSEDGTRSIKGVTGREVESVAGYSGRQLVIIDEASHLTQKKFEAFVGNSMGGAHYLFMISQPLHTEGPFYDAFHDMADYFQAFSLSSLDTAQWQQDNGLRIEGLATLDAIEQLRDMFGGVDSPFYIWRVLGEFLRNETGKVVPMWMIEEAVLRYATAPDEGRLQIGYDPAGPGDQGDEHAWAIVRGAKCLAIIRRRGLTVDAAMADTFSLMRLHRRGDEEPVLVVDQQGPIGGEFFGRFRAEAERCAWHDRANRFELHGFLPSSKRVRERTKFERRRDEIWWTLADWMRTGAIPNDDKLKSEIHHAEWQSTVGGLLKVSDKDSFHAALNRSPDSADALTLATMPLGQDLPDPGPASPPPPRTQNPYDTTRVFNPYDGPKAFMPKNRGGGGNRR